MTTMRVTITKSGRSNEYGQPLVVGTTYTVDEALGISLVKAQYATDTNGILDEPQNYPYDQVVLEDRLLTSAQLDALTRRLVPEQTENASFVDGATPWTRLVGPSELNSAFSKSAEISGHHLYNGGKPCWWRLYVSARGGVDPG
jgi:hypothetical protein